MLLLLKKPAEKAFMYSNQVLTRQAVASEQQLYCESASILAVSPASLHSKAKLHTQVPTAVLFKGYISSS